MSSTGLADASYETLEEDSTNSDASEAKVAVLLDLAAELKCRRYEWRCPSPETEAIVNARFSNRYAHNLTGLFGWNRVCFLETLARLLPAGLIDELQVQGVLQILDGESARSRVRFSSVGSALFAQSAWPHHLRDAVTIGPETERFAMFLERELTSHEWPLQLDCQPSCVVDLGWNGGACGILAMQALAVNKLNHAPTLRFVHPSPAALRFAEVNARISHIRDFECRQSTADEVLSGDVMLVVGNLSPLFDPQASSLEGAADHGVQAELRVLESCLEHLPPGAAFLTIAIAPVVRGVDVFRQHLEAQLARFHFAPRKLARYEVLDTDIFGSRLSQPAYAEVERLTQVAVAIHRPVTSQRE